MTDELDISHPRLEARQQRALALTELLPAMLFETDARGQLVYANRWALENLGYAPEDIEKGFHALQFVAPEDQARAAQNIRRAITGERLDLNEYTFMTAGGERLAVMLQSAPILTDGEVTGLRGVILDITARKRAEAAAAESEAKYRQLVNHAPTGIYEVDLQTGKLIEVNDVMCEYTGYSRQELMERGPMSLLAEESVAIFAARHQKILAGEPVPENVEYRIRAKDGHQLWVMVNSKLHHERGRPVRATVVAHDLTELKQAQEEKERMAADLVRAQRMQAVGRLAGGVAHDFNNLLSAMQGHVSLLLAELAADDPSRHAIARIDSCIASASSLTHQLVGFSRGGPHESQAIDTNRLMSDSADMFGRTQKRIQISMALAPNAWSIQGDRAQLEQVVLNLLVNSADAMPGGGELILGSENRDLSSDLGAPYNLERGRYVELTVVDTGHGMDDATREHIFEPFFTTRERAQGTGLGLATAYGIIERHRGAIRAHSQPGEGTRMEILIPATEEVAPVEPVVAETEIVPRSATVLVVEDEDIVREVNVLMLERLVTKVYEAAGGAEALEIFEAHHGEIDLVLLDLVMPGMNGPDTFDRLRAIDPGVRVLLSSGYSDESQFEELMERGCLGLIEKPFPFHALAAEIERLLPRS